MGMNRPVQTQTEALSNSGTNIAGAMFVGYRTDERGPRGEQGGRISAARPTMLGRCPKNPKRRGAGDHASDSAALDTPCGRARRYIFLYRASTAATAATAGSAQGRQEGIGRLLISKVSNIDQTAIQKAPILFNIPAKASPGASVTERPVVLPPAKKYGSRHG
jgi:hypothetical protein